VKDPQRGADHSVLWQVKDGQPTPIEDDKALAGYVSSVASDQARALVTSKEGHCALRLEHGAIVETRHLEGASAAAVESGLTALSGYARLDINRSVASANLGHEWDNHGIALRGLA
jgi:hypothetical protein